MTILNPTMRVVVSTTTPAFGATTRSAAVFVGSSGIQWQQYVVGGAQTVEPTAGGHLSRWLEEQSAIPIVEVEARRARSASNVVKAKRVVLQVPVQVQAPLPAPVHPVTKAVRVPLTGAAAAETLRRNEVEKKMTIESNVHKKMTKAVRVPLTAAAAEVLRRKEEEKLLSEMTDEQLEKRRAEQKRIEEQLAAERQAAELRRAAEERAKRQMMSKMRRSRAVVTKARRVLITDASYYDDEE